MSRWFSDSAVVVIVRGVRDISRTTLPDEEEAERYIGMLLVQGIPRNAIRIYHTRLVRPYPRTV